MTSPSRIRRIRISRTQGTCGSLELTVLAVLGADDGPAVEFVPRDDFSAEIPAVQRHRFDARLASVYVDDYISCRESRSAAKTVMTICWAQCPRGPSSLFLIPPCSSRRCDLRIWAAALIEVRGTAAPLLGYRQTTRRPHRRALAVDGGYWPGERRPAHSAQSLHLERGVERQLASSPAHRVDARLRLTADASPAPSSVSHIAV